MSSSYFRMNQYASDGPHSVFHANAAATMLYHQRTNQHPPGSKTVLLKSCEGLEELLRRVVVSLANSPTVPYDQHGADLLRLLELCSEDTREYLETHGEWQSRGNCQLLYIGSGRFDVVTLLYADCSLHCCILSLAQQASPHHHIIPSQLILSPYKSQRPQRLRPPVILIPFRP
jgi:hypothetical protein